MPDLTIQPTSKFLKAGVILALIVVIALEAAYLIWWRDSVSALVMLFPPLILLWPAMRAMRRRFMKTVISGDRLRYEVGVASKSTRNIQLSKLQDVRVDQTMMQRMFNIGDLAIETAGEGSRLVIRHVDNPQALADEIMNRAQRGATT